MDAPGSQTEAGDYVAESREPSQQVSGGADTTALSQAKKREKGKIIRNAVSISLVLVYSECFRFFLGSSKCWERKTNQWLFKKGLCWGFSLKLETVCKGIFEKIFNFSFRAREDQLAVKKSRQAIIRS